MESSTATPPAASGRRRHDGGGLPADRRGVPGPRRRAHQGRRGLADLGASCATASTRSPAACQARRAQGDTVALMFGNRPEFHIADLAVMTLGATPFSLYTTLSPEQIQYVIEDAGAKVALIEEAHLEQVDGARELGLPRPRDGRRARGRAGRGHRRLGRRRGVGPRLRRRAALARAGARATC